MEKMNGIKKEVKGILNKLPCVNQGCNGTGAYPFEGVNYFSGEREEGQRQCQFCYEIRYPFIKQSTRKIIDLINKQWGGEKD